jgi:hypothetical protein
MPTSKEYRQHAEECLELAKQAEEFYVKTALVELADEFKEQAKKNRTPVRRCRPGRRGIRGCNRLRAGALTVNRICKKMNAELGPIQATDLQRLWRSEFANARARPY